MADWRIDNARWTRDAVLQFKKYVRPREDWDHDHCEACWAKLMDSVLADVLTEGYVTEDNRWVCPQCFSDLKEEMGWKLGLAGGILLNVPLGAAASAAAATTAAGTRARRGFATIGGRGEDRQLQCLFPARALRARNRGLPVHHQALVVLAAIVTNVFVDRH